MKKQAHLLIWFGVFLALGVFFQNCSKGDYSAADPENWGGSEDGASSGVSSGCKFNGLTLAEGQSITAYLNSTPEFTNGCLSETRTCTGGVLSGTFAFGSCKAGPKSCLFNGATILSDGTVTGYSQVSSANTCEQETRKCTDGVLSGDLPFSYCGASCIFDGKSFKAGDTFTYYPASMSVTCQQKTGRCELGGKLVDATTGAALKPKRTFASCTTQNPNCNFNGTTLTHGQTFTYYLTATAATCQPQQGSCQNGKLVNLSGVEVTGYASCSDSQTPSATSCVVKNNNYTSFQSDLKLPGTLTIPRNKRAELLRYGFLLNQLTCSGISETCTIGSFMFGYIQLPSAVSRVPAGTVITSGQYVSTCMSNWWQRVYVTPGDGGNPGGDI